MASDLVPAHDFGGLDLRRSPDDVGLTGAIDLLDVELDIPGVARRRPGFEAFTAAEAAARYDSLIHYLDPGTTGTNSAMLAGRGKTLEILSVAGSSKSTDTKSTASPHYFTRWGSPSANRIYIANGTDTVRYLTPATDAFTTPAYTGVTPKGKFLAVTPWDNRLVSAWETSEKSIIRFSDEGDPHTFPTNNFERVTPGDGEEITGLAVWREYLFVFKETKFFVFYGVSTAPTGEPIFDYRPVEGGIGLRGPRALAAAEDGVYFVAADGVYRTSGGVPERISRDLDPLFTSPAPLYHPVRSGGDFSLGFLRGRLYMSIQNADESPAGAPSCYVYEVARSLWTANSLPAGAMVARDEPGIDRLYFVASEGGKHVGFYSPGGTAEPDAVLPAASQYVRSFDGVDDRIELFPSAPLIANVSLVAAVRPQAVDVGVILGEQFSPGGGASITGICLAINSAGKLAVLIGNTLVSSTLTLTQNDWSLVGVDFTRTNSGSGTLRVHLYDYKGAKASHQDLGAVSLPTPPGVPSLVIIGSRYSSTSPFPQVDYFTGDIAAGWLGTALGDGDFESMALAESMADWSSVGKPLSRWTLGQPATTFGVTDLIGNCNESVLVGTSVVEDDPPIPYVNEAGTGFSGRWRAGFYDLGAETEKRLQALDVWGTGEITVKGSRDFGALDSGVAVSLGTAPAIDHARASLGTKDGTVFSHQFEGQGLWRVYRSALLVEGARMAGTNTP